MPTRTTADYFHNLKNEYNRNIVKKLDTGDVDDADILLYLKLKESVHKGELGNQCNSQDKKSESSTNQAAKEPTADDANTNENSSKVIGECTKSVVQSSFKGKGRTKQQRKGRYNSTPRQ